jgi:hypothetical protein
VNTYEWEIHYRDGETESFASPDAAVRPSQGVMSVKDFGGRWHMLFMDAVRSITITTRPEGA